MRECYIAARPVPGTSHSAKMPLTPEVRARLDDYCTPEAWKTMVTMDATHLIYGPLEPGFVKDGEVVNIQGAEDAIEACKAYIRDKLERLPWVRVVEINDMGGLSHEPYGHEDGCYLEAKITLRDGAQPPDVPVLRRLIPQYGQMAQSNPN